MSAHRRRHEPQAWHGRPLAALDLETTGVDPWHDRIVAYALVDDRGVRSGLVDPAVPIPPAAVQVHGLDAARLAGAPCPPVAVAHVLGWLEQVIAWQLPLVVFNAPYDLTMIAAEARRYRYAEPEWSDLLVIDPMVVDWGLDRERRGQRRLTDVAAHYGVTLDRAHDARSDAVAALEIALAIGTAHPAAGSASDAELMAQQRQWFAERAREWNGWAREHDRPETDPAGWPLAADPVSPEALVCP